jgi:membrane glycosyltransferase
MATYRNPGSPPEVVANPEREPQSTVGLLRKLMDELSTLLRQELSLARAEVADSLSAAKTGVASIAAGGAVLFAALLVILETAILALAQVMVAWLAALIVGVIVGIAGYVMLHAGRKKLEPSALKPTQTQESLRRDAEILGRRNS